MDGIKKTALLLSGLEPNMVDQLLGRLDPEDAKAVRRKIMSLGNVSETESNRVAVEFLEASGAHRKSISKTEIRSNGTMNGFYDPPTKAQPKPMRFPAEAFEPRVRRPFDFLADVETEMIVHEISSEHPQTIAVVLTHIPKSRATEILGAFPIVLRKDVSRRLMEYESVDEQLVTEIADALRERLDNSRCDFSVLERLNNAELSQLFHSVNIETAVLALVGAGTSLIERVVKRFTPTEEHEFRRQIKRLGTIDERDVEQARTIILDQLTQSRIGSRRG